MPSQAMQDAMDALGDRQKASASKAPPTLAERRAAFTPRDRFHLVPDDVLVTEVTAGGVPAHWLGQTAYTQQPPRCPPRPLPAQYPESLLITPTEPAERHHRTRTVTTTGEAHDRPAGLTRRAELRA
jgi:hypothetical protein